MRLTAYTDYSLRVLMYLGLTDGRRATIREISDSYGISKNHLMKIVLDLRRDGFVNSVRGKGGGIELASAPDRIQIGDVVRKTEPDFHVVECFDAHHSKCRIRGGCVLADALDEALAAFLDVLDGYTLADLVRPKHKLSRLLDLTGPTRKMH